MVVGFREIFIDPLLPLFEFKPPGSVICMLFCSTPLDIPALPEAMNKLAVFFTSGAPPDLFGDVLLDMGKSHSKLRILAVQRTSPFIEIPFASNCTKYRKYGIFHLQGIFIALQIFI